MEYRDQTFENRRVEVEGHTFTGCTFRNCEFVFRGVVPFHMSANHMYDVRWAFEGPALTMLRFLHDLYHQNGEYGREFVERLFNDIRQPRPEN